jgi:hypothetical protein
VNSIEVTIPDVTSSDIIDTGDLIDWEEHIWQDTIKVINHYLWIFLWVIAMWVFMYGWISLMFSSWNAEQLKKATNMLIFWWIGIWISVLAYILIKIIVNLF